MSNLILLLAAAAWAAVLVPPLVRSRLRNSPTSSVSNFRRQLSSLQRDTRPIPRDRKSTRLNSSHVSESRMPSSA